MAKYLTNRERDILGFIKEFIKDNKYSPSLDEIRVAMGLSSISTIHEHVSRLQFKGFLEKHPHKSRSMKVKKDSTSSMTITTLQDLAIQSDKKIGTLEPHNLFNPKKGCVAVAIQGNTLSHEGVMDGDYIIVIPGNGVMDGDTIVGLVDGYKPILGNLYHFGPKIVIKPIRGDRDSIVLDPESVVIIGRAKGVVRQL